MGGGSFDWFMLIYQFVWMVEEGSSTDPSLEHSSWSGRRPEKGKGQNSLTLTFDTLTVFLNCLNNYIKIPFIGLFIKANQSDLDRCCL